MFKFLICTIYFITLTMNLQYEYGNLWKQETNCYMCIILYFIILKAYNVQKKI